MMRERLLDRAGLCGLAAAALLVSAMAHSPAAAQTTLRFAHWLPPTHSNHKSFEAWNESLKKATNGELSVRIFPAQQLGAAADHYDMARDGVADITHVNPGYQAGRFPIVGAATLPFLFSNATGGSRAIHEWYIKYAEREMRDVKVCNVFVHAPATIHSKKPVRVPEDIRGMKVRPAHAMMAQMVTLLGGSSVQLSAPESREALERGVADAITFPWGSLIRPWGIDKAVNHHLDMALYVTVFVNPVNKAAYDRLSPAHRTALDAHCTPEWSQQLAALWAGSEQKGYEELKARKGHVVYTPSAEEQKRWHAAVAPLYEQWKKAVDDSGLRGDEVLKELRSALRKNNALAQ
jgi:TRAP-type transport system periplasmic protein